MELFKIIGLAIVKYIGIVFVATALVLVTIFTYFPLQLLLFGRGNYLLFVSSTFNMVPVIMIIILIIYAFFHMKFKYFMKKRQVVEQEEEVEGLIGSKGLDELSVDIAEGNRLLIFLVKLINNLLVHESILEKIYIIIKKCYISALLIAIYCGMTSFTILYSDSIKISTPINPIGTVYDYSQIKRIDVGISEYKKTYTPYYRITVDKKAVDLFGGTVSESGYEDLEDVLLSLDRILKSKDIPKTIDKSNFENFAKGLDENYVRDVEKLFK